MWGQLKEWFCLLLRWLFKSVRKLIHRLPSLITHHSSKDSQDEESATPMEENRVEGLKGSSKESSDGISKRISVKSLEKISEFSPEVAYPLLHLEKELHAIVIGINDYQGLMKLRSSVKDADDVEHFLRNTLLVPSERIRVLSNEKATRKGILTALESFWTPAPTTVKDGSTILIYFSGHGTRTIVSKECRAHDPQTEDGEIEAICPVDFNTLDEDGKIIKGIPDIMLKSMVQKISEVVKTDNIIVCLDCCHSGHGLRLGGDSDTEIRVRGIDSDKSSCITDADLVFNNTEYPVKSTVNILDVSVLLSACARDEKAREKSNGGFFTQALLRLLHDPFCPNFTYGELIQYFKMSVDNDDNKQHPQCESNFTHRYLFREDVANASYISGFVRDHEGEGNGPIKVAVLHAGGTSGISVGSVFEIFEKIPQKDDTPCICRIEIQSVNTHQSFSRMEKSNTFPPKFYARLTGLGDAHKLPIFVRGESQEIERIKSSTKFKAFATCSHNGEGEKEAKLVMSLDSVANKDNQKSECAVLAWSAGYMKSEVQDLTIGQPILVTDIVYILRVIEAASKFCRYLDISHVSTAPSKSYLDQIEIELQLLTRTDSDIFYDDTLPPTFQPSKTPVEKIARGDGYILSRSRQKKRLPSYGMKITNGSPYGVYVYVLRFDTRDLQIRLWYSSPISNNLDGPLLPRRSLTIGYGEEGVAPWTPEIEDQDKIVYLLVIVTNRPNNSVESLEQESPFVKDREDSSSENPPKPVSWGGAKRIMVVLKNMDEQTETSA